jgi:hypothetical protein
VFIFGVRFGVRFWCSFLVFIFSFWCSFLVFVLGFVFGVFSVNCHVSHGG